MGSIRFTATLVKRGPAAAIVLDDEQVAAAGEDAGDTVEVALELDTAPRERRVVEALERLRAGKPPR